MACSPKYTKKYLGRNSPPFPANECKNQKRVGNDGSIYESRRASNGVHRWVKNSYKSKYRSYKKSPKKLKSKRRK